jgi:hypothetical protein
MYTNVLAYVYILPRFVHTKKKKVRLHSSHRRLPQLSSRGRVELDMVKLYK